MTDSRLERELKFEVPEDFVVPDPCSVLADTELTTDTVTLSSTYYDTPALDLLRRRMTLRRRTGDDDTGWQLKVPAGKAREEIRVPLAAPSIGEGPRTEDHTAPVQLTDLLGAIVAVDALEPVALVRTERRRLRAVRRGRVVVEVADDRVTVSVDGHDDTSWREVEVELGKAGDERALRAVATQLRRADARASRSRSKLETALRVRDPEGSLLTQYLTASTRRLLVGDLALRRGRNDVHQTRVSVRRIRSALRVFAPLLDAGAAERLDAELSWYQDLLGKVRDREVQRAHFREALAAVPTTLVLGPVGTRLDARLAHEQAVAWQDVRDALDSQRYRALLAAVWDFASDPVPHAGAAELDRAAARLARRARRRAAARLDRALAGARAEQLHRARKAIKRARYASELAAPTQHATIKRFKRAQDVLGAHQDATVSAQLLRRLGIAAGTTPDENGFTFGLLLQRELDEATRRRAQAARLRLRG